MSLSRLLPGCRFIACDEIMARRCQDVAAACRPGDVFVARLTPRGDGHEDVAEAIARGAVGVVAERMVSTDGVPLCLVRDSDAAFARLCHALAGDPSREMRVITVVGTNGKTTTAWLIAAVLAEAGHRVAVLSDLGCLGPDDVEPELVDYASPAVLAARLAAFSASGCSHAIVEVSSDMLAARATAGISCDTVVATGLVASATGRHGTRRAYRGIVARIMESLGEDGCLVTGAGPRHTAELLAAAPATTTCLTAGLTAGCDVGARPVEESLFGRTFLATCGGQSVPIGADTPTVPFVRDVVLALAVGVRYGVTLERGARGIELTGGVPGRVERIDRGQDAAVFTDCPSNPHACRATLASLRRLTPGRLAVIVDERAATRLGGQRLPRSVARWCDSCLVVPASIAADDPDAADVEAYARLDRLLSSLGRGDCVVVLGHLPRWPRSPLPDPSQPALVQLVDGWLQLAHPAEAPRRRAA
ncbi:MAG: Mur ligase family protein [Pirellulales bacterium]